MTDKEISDLLNKSESKFQRCWKVLELMKQYRIDSNDFPHFQSILADAIFDLCAGYNNICEVRKKLISKKATYNPKWFAKRQKLLDDRQKALNQAVSIGKTLGDAFAWFFYQRDRELLLEHAKHPSIDHISTGLGGIGEREFIRHAKVIGPFMVLYHGTTTLLRIGDVSLIDLRKFRVAAIGELKTGPAEPGTLSMTLLFVGPNQNLEPFLKNALKKQPEKALYKDLCPSVQARLKRQLTKITKTLDTRDSKPNAGTVTKEERRPIMEFEKLVLNAKANQFTNGKLSRSIICSIYKQRVRCLTSKLIPKKKREFALKNDDLSQQVRTILLEKSRDNNFWTSPLLYSREGKATLLPGAIPVFWWPIRIDILKKLIFQDIIVVNIFNPAHFIQLLKSKGYQLILIKGERPRFIKKIGSATIALQGIPFFLRMIQHDLFDEEQIVDSIGDVEEVIKEKRITGNAKIDIVFNHVFSNFHNFDENRIRS